MLTAVRRIALMALLAPAAGAGNSQPPGAPEQAIEVTVVGDHRFVACQQAIDIIPIFLYVNWGIPRNGVETGSGLQDWERAMEDASEALRAAKCLILKEGERFLAWPSSRTVSWNVVLDAIEGHLGISAFPKGGIVKVTRYIDSAGNDLGWSPEQEWFIWADALSAFGRIEP